MSLSLKKILSYVIAVHLVLGLSLFADWRHSVKKSHHLIVKTVRLSPVVSPKKESLPPTISLDRHDLLKSEESSPSIVSQPPLVHSDLSSMCEKPGLASPPKTKESKKVSSSKQSAKMPKKEVQKTVVQSKETKPKIDEKKKKLLLEAKNKIAKIGPVNSTETKEKVPLAKINEGIGSLSSVSSTETLEARYIEKMSALLQGSLRLPESGDVCLNIKLDRTGKVVEWNIISSMSEKNGSYVKIHFPKLHFPPFQSEWPGEKQHTFFLTLSDL